MEVNNGKIQFSINKLFSSIWPIDRTLLVDLWTMGIKVYSAFPKILALLTGDSPSDCLMFCLGHSLEKYFPSVEIQSVYSTADWASDNAEFADKESWRFFSDCFSFSSSIDSSVREEAGWLLSELLSLI